MKIRRPAVAGLFYPGTPSELRVMIEELFKSIGSDGIPSPNNEGARRITALMLPHAGYIYSGRTAAAGYRLLAADGTPETIILLGPNHTGMGAGLSISDSDRWETPLGWVEVDKELGEAVVEIYDEVSFDDLAHMSEHSIEVQIPFLQAIYGSTVRILPLSMALQSPEYSISLGRALATATIKLERDALVIASSDMSHYVPETVAEARDRKVLERVVQMDIEGMYRLIIELDVSMCGPGPVAAAIEFSKVMGAREGRLIRYSTSAETTGDRSSVVGYASVVFSR